jgi:hypothetical protein
VRLKSALKGHAVKTVSEIGWCSTKDPAFLAYAEQHFDVFVTVDQRLVRDLDVTRFQLGFVIARVRKNRIEDFQPIVDDLLTAIARVRMGEVLCVPTPER